MTQNESPVWVSAYLGLGSNLGDRIGHIKEACNKLGHVPTIQVRQVSSPYETAPVGLINQPDFVNAAVHIKTLLAPEDLLAQILHLEQVMGRVRTIRWGPRVIDIDILAYNNQTVNIPGLTIPHPALTQRAFVLVPLAEIAPELILPGETSPVKILADIQSKKGNNWGSFVVTKLDAGRLSI